MKVIYRECSYDEILPLKGKDAKYCGFQYGDKAVYVGAFLGEEIIGCCGYIEKGRAIEYVNDVVSLQYRGKGIYHHLWNVREGMITVSHDKEYAYCTKMSIGKYLKEGFAIIKEYKNTYKVERKVYDILFRQKRL